VPFAPNPPGMRRLVVGVLALALLTPGASAVGRAPAGPASGEDYLRALVRMSRPPEYRRFGTDAMVRIASYIGTQLRRDGFRVLADDVGGLHRWAVDYTAGHRPQLTRLADGHRFKTESAFDIAPTPPEGIECTVRKLADVGPGDCGLVPFSDASPEWKNPTNHPAQDVDTILAKGGVGAVVQGDLARNLVYAVRLRRAIPAVVSVAGDDEIVGQRVRIRVMGASVPATAHNTVAVLRPPAGAAQYVMLLGHADGWFQAAADNGGGAAAVLRAAQLLAAHRPGLGVVVALVDGEELGLLGSLGLTQQLSSPAGVDVGDGGPPLHMADLKAVINLDASSARASDAQDQVRSALGQDAPLFSWRAMVFSEEPVLPAAFLTTFAAHKVLGLPLASKAAVAIEGGWRTDAQWFHQAGVPVVWPVAGYPEYHTDGDTLAAVDPADLEAIAEAATDLAGQLATLPVGPVDPVFR